MSNIVEIFRRYLKGPIKAVLNIQKTKCTTKFYEEFY
jgi:hypothetical protein